MLVEAYKNILYSDLQLPDIFVTEYLPSMDGDYVKIYIYCMFLSKYKKRISSSWLSKKLDIDQPKIDQAITYFENMGLIIKKGQGLILTDLKEKEINKIYRLKATSSPEEALLSSQRNKLRSNTISSINNKFFQGVMSPSWYIDIDAWFDKYKFDEDVMYTLFQHCYDHKGLSKNYILKVAESWYSKNIVTSFDLDRYYIQYQKIKDIRLKIVKKLKLNRFLTEYEEEFVERWVIDYQYGFDIIELALKKTTGKTSPSFNYISTILKSWFELGLKTKEQIQSYQSSSTSSNALKIKETSIPQHANFEQRKYSKEDDDNFFTNLAK